ncbi:MAG: alpha/beta hydrolase-fold protein [Kofleriaceae bacterium]
MRTLLLPALLVACSSSATPSIGDGATADGRNPDADADAAAQGCPAGKAGAACILALADAAADCDPVAVDKLRIELDARRTLGPLWANGRALFRTAAPIHVAGSFNGWSPTAAETAPLCGTELVLATLDVASGNHPYKLTDGTSWLLDPDNPAFAYDDFGGNPEGINSMLATPDSGRGYLVKLERACSAALGNCRDVTAYLPAGYDALDQVDRSYPVLFMHDGQNVWDDHDCCFGHTGWETNVTLDAEIAAGRVAPVIVIAAAHSSARNDEYGLSEQKLASFMEFQVAELQPRALAQVRWNGGRVAVAGSSLGGLVAMTLGLTYPETYGAAVSLSGAFWPGQDTGTALRDKLPVLGKQALAIYLDHGGNLANNSDGAADSIEVRDLLSGIGWQLASSPACAPGPDALCYHAEPGATHDELAWKARTWRFLRFLFPR